MSVHAQENFLREILDLLVLPDKPSEERKDPRSSPLDKLGEGNIVSVARSFDQVI
jgi:hypothetical protein